MADEQTRRDLLRQADVFLVRAGWLDQAREVRDIAAELEQAERGIEEARDEVPQEFLDAAAKQVERAEQAERERDEMEQLFGVDADMILERIRSLEARLAKVPPLVEALQAVFSDPHGEYVWWQQVRDALAAWEQE